MGKEIKIKFTDGTENYGKQMIIEWLGANGYTIEISENPDYVIYGPHGYECLNYPDAVRIFITCEDIAPDFNICDYAVGFDDISFGDRYLRYPQFLTYKDDMSCLPFRSTAENIRQKLSPETRFCSFVVSNGNADSKREEFFKNLSEYKKVDSGGKYLNNIGDAVKDKREFDKEHKFAITFENASHPGYTTEKILQGFAAGLVPIYWGDPNVGRYFNIKAFINISSVESMEEAVARVIEIDNNIEKYEQMLLEPVFADEKIVEERNALLNSFLQHIFSQSISDAKRVTGVFWNKMYNDRLRKMRMFRDAWYKVKCVFHIK